jgi:formiminoglutamase
MRSKTLSPTLDPRLSNHWKTCAANELKRASSRRDIVILSHADDEGVRLNNGRPGAVEGPERILHFLGRMVSQSKSPSIFVLSDRKTHLRLSERHEASEQIATKIFSLGYRLITLGGGHDYGFPDAAAFLKCGGSKVLNIDAHMDVRPVIDDKLNSGTAFSRLIERFGGRCLVEWGIQSQTNAESQIQWALKQGTKIFSFEKPLPKISGKVGLSVCLDAFAGIRGVSAPQFLGLSPVHGLQAIRRYGKRSSWLGLYESAPSLDPQTQDSARLAAAFAYHFIHS